MNRFLELVFLAVRLRLIFVFLLFLAFRFLAMRLPLHSTHRRVHPQRPIADSRPDLDPHLNVRMTFFIGAALDFFLAIDAPERLPFKGLTEIGMRRSSYEVHGPPADRTGGPIIRTEVRTFFYTHCRFVAAAQRTPTLQAGARSFLSHRRLWQCPPVMRIRWRC